MALTREGLLEGMTTIVQRYTNITEAQHVAAMVDNVIDVGFHFAQDLSSNKTAAYVQQFIQSIAEKSNTADKKSITGMAFTLSLVVIGLSENLIGSLSGIYLAEAFGEEASAEKETVANMMREVYILALPMKK